jgi:RNA ligase (TIGR02306 family)
MKIFSQNNKETEQMNSCVQSTRPLAVVGKISQLHAIADADRIVQAQVDCGAAGRWQAVVGLDYVVDQPVVVFLQDALLPQDERWAFLARNNWRIKMSRFRGVPSECLVIADDIAQQLPLGTDLTAHFGVQKYEKPIPNAMNGVAIANFPSSIPKTDETNIQAAFALLDRMAVEPWYATEKADGTSCTVWQDSQGLHVCSRNLELAEFDETGKTNLYWRAARQYQLDRLPIGLALQFEIVGEGVQGNPMGIKHIEIRVFSVFDQRSRCYQSAAQLQALCQQLSLPTARWLFAGIQAGQRVDVVTLQTWAAITYANGKPAEGMVIRAADSTWSFKVINLLYKG